MTSSIEMASLLQGSEDNTAPKFDVVRKGTLSMGVGGLQDEARGVVCLENGRIVVVGDSYVNSLDFSVVQLLDNGMPDQSFGDHGKVIVDVKGDNRYDLARAVTLQPGGKILVAGSSDRDFALVRLLPDGQLDITFNDTGKWTYNISNDAWSPKDEAYSVALQSTGKILVSGYSRMDGSYDFAVAKLDANGELDKGFGSDGVKTVDLGGYADYGTCMVLEQSDDSILLGGYGYNGQYLSYGLVHLYSNGAVDRDFGVDGKALLPVGENVWVSGMALQSTGKIIVVSRADGDMGIIRLNENGSWDSSFLNTGSAFPDIFRGDDYATSVVVQPDDDKIVIAGYTTLPSGSTEVVVVRLTAEGEWDTTFSDDGIFTLNLSPGFDAAYSVTLQPDHKILLVGQSEGRSVEGGTANVFALVRLNEDGSLDRSFGDPQNANATLHPEPAGQAEYVENGAPVPLDSEVAIFDAELAALNDGHGNYSGALLTIGRTGGSSSEDEFSGHGALSLDNGQATLSGVTVGTVHTDDGTLSIEFNSAATQERVNAVLSSIGYANQSDAPPDDVELTWTFKDGTGDEAQSVSASTLVKIQAFNDAPTGDVGVTGSAIVGGVLSASNTLSDADGLGDIQYQWLRESVDIDGASGEAYTLTDQDVGHAISVRASYVDGGGTLEEVVSGATAAVQPLTPGVGYAYSEPLETSETDQQHVSIQVRLLAAPTRDVLVSFKLSDATEGIFLASSNATTSILFTPDNWNQAQTLTVVGVDDALDDGDQAFVLSAAVTSGDERYNGMRSGEGLPIANLEITNKDNDQPDDRQGDEGGVTVNDELHGGPGVSTLHGWAGNDSLFGGGGDDKVYGGNGDDALHGEDGADVLYGESGNDSLDGGAGNDTLDGGTGADTLAGGAGRDVYVVDSRMDVVRETSALKTEVDTVMSSLSWTLGARLENLVLTGDAAIDGTGNTANNLLVGNAAANVLKGGGGKDVLVGGGGADRLTGGGGHDVFRFAAWDDLGLDKARDVITDFTRGQDRIDLSPIDANASKAGDQAFAFVTSGFGKAPGQVMYANGIVSINTDTDAAAEYQIQLVGKVPATLSASDFLL